MNETGCPEWGTEGELKLTFPGSMRRGYRKKSASLSLYKCPKCGERWSW